MIIHILSSESYRSFEAVWIEVVTPQGGLVILESHASLIVSLVQDKPISIMLITGKHELVHVQKQAILECKEGNVTVVL